MAARTPVPPPARLDIASLARRFRVVPIALTDVELQIATSDPLDVECERTLGFATGRHVRLALADADAIDQRIDELYGLTGPLPEPELFVDVQHLDNEREIAPPSTSDDSGASATHLVDELLAAGIGGRASDIH